MMLFTQSLKKGTSSGAFGRIIVALADQSDRWWHEFREKRAHGGTGEKLCAC